MINLVSVIKDRGRLALCVATLGLLVSNLLLIVQNLQYKAAVEQSKQLITEEGFKFSDLKIKPLDGTEETVTFDHVDMMTLLLVFNPSCEYCVQEYPYWKELVAKLDMGRWRVLAVSAESDLDNIRRHLEEHTFENVKAGSISREDVHKARLRYTPMTLALDPTGEVKKVWPGLWKKGFELPKHELYSKE